MNEDWKYVKSLKNGNAVDEFEKQNNICFPQDLKDFILKNNGRRPHKMTIDTADTKKRVFKSLLSFNRDDKETIFTMYPVIQKENPELIPFASDPFGNFYCVHKKDKKIILWLHETAKTEFVAASFSELLEKLY